MTARFDCLAGADTVSLGDIPFSQPLIFYQSVSALVSFLLAMTVFPEVQKRAQAEIDQVVGNDRLPKLSDRMHLPYCKALCKEIHRFVFNGHFYSKRAYVAYAIGRWSPVVPLGVAHSTREHDSYNGYFIPAKSVIIPNQWWAVYQRSGPSEHCDELRF